MKRKWLIQVGRQENMELVRRERKVKEIGGE